MEHTESAEKRPRSEEVSTAAEPEAKRPREADNGPRDASAFTNLPSDVPPAVSRLGLKPQLPVLPSSLKLATGKEADLSERMGFVGEEEVGIIGYLGNPQLAGIHGVIKQR